MGSCNSYLSHFNDICTYLSYADEVKIVKFYEGLKDEIKDHLIICLDKPTDFHEYTKLCVHIDNELHKRDIEKCTKANNKLTNSTNSPYTKAARPECRYNPLMPATQSAPSEALSPGVPMEIDATHTAQHRGPLTPEEHQKRKDKGLCMYCGGPGHNADSCPNMSDRKKKAIAAAATKRSPARKA
ncbi:hypothetical protein EW146_g7057 [Bondarzewia mesenterica]|uniref:CCHC-type domain-containing protein n=1 Tax=Bondarzewia mesenterica TaxID=1095465 RepID=A0A4S4LNQ7_9AGAM|nr:hypothetical protein EW146_g7057 [Bondarzewia mesenterica]